MSRYTESLVGFDNSIELMNIANSLLKESKVSNLKFIYATTKTQLPFQDEQFDLIYDRRGPTSILNHSRILQTGGTVFGIHSGSLEKEKRTIRK
ncbi:hypothetical protein PUR_41970 [Paenibacillus sp. URB8-2]|nr:hypothetical protein PUR_41970 [Paenibacillus sp. URB8-2]